MLSIIFWPTYIFLEVDEEWRSARSSVYETQEVTIRWVHDSPSEEQPAPELIRPASKVWKRAMAPEVHADLVRALKARESQDERLTELQEVEVRRTHTILITDADMNGWKTPMQRKKIWNDANYVLFAYRVKYEDFFSALWNEFCLFVFSSTK